ncbi:MAG: methyltransferase domain-containing protein [Deltaproteobacteria bacterium]|nr:methyltransferase domain-containing protein [Deltaproteobacteria bacterium]
MDLETRLRRRLQRMYDQAAACDAGLLSPVNLPRGRALLLDLGYPEAAIARLPAWLLAKAFPCGNPLPAIAALRPRPASILDLGCGCGLDACLLASEWRENGKITALDLSGRLLSSGRQAARELGLARLAFVQGDAGRLPFRRSAFDLVTMNGSFNVIVDKEGFLRQLATRLTPGGRLLINDLLLVEPLPPGFVDEPDNWAWNIAGALTAEGYRQLCRRTGFSLVSLRRGELMAPVQAAELLLRRAD